MTAPEPPQSSAATFNHDPDRRVNVCAACDGKGYIESGVGGPASHSMRTCLDCDGTGTRHAD